jgi:negative regulator of sigma E activity
MTDLMQKIPQLVVSPEKVKGRQGKFLIIIRNRENTVTTYQIQANDPHGLCDYNLDKERVTIDAGATSSIELTVKFKKILLAGTSKICNFTVSSIKSNNETVSATGQLESPSRVPVWALAACAVAVIAAVVVGVALGNNGSNPNDQIVSPGKTTSETMTGSNTVTAPVSTTPTTTNTVTTTHVTNPASTQTSSTASTTTTSITTTSTQPPSTTQTTDTTPNLNGTWKFTITITQANGVCAGDVGHSSSRLIQITQSSYDVTLSGFLGNPANKLTGNITLDGGAWIIKVSGSYPEDGGTTNSTHTLTLTNATELNGQEDWTWSGTGESCPGGKATVKAVKEP